MLKGVCIKNFKSHRETTLDFVEGVNCITGVSSYGKSAILDSIRLVSENDRTANDIITNNIKTNQCSIKLMFDDCDVELQKNKGTKPDKYILTTSNNKEEFTHFSRTVPEEVLNALKITETNFQNQHTQPFLVYGGKTAYSKEINKIIGLGDTVSRLKLISSKILSLKKDLKRKKAEKEKTENFLNSLTSYEQLREKELKLKELEEKIDKKKETLKKMKELKVFFDVDEIKRTKELIEVKIKNFIQTEKEILRKKEKLDLIKGIKTEIVKFDIDSLKKKIEKGGKLQKNIEVKEDLLELLTNYIASKGKLKKAKNKLNEFDGQICFNCGSEIKI